jgi:malonyl-ACP O-methyltransferase BioC
MTRFDKAVSTYDRYATVQKDLFTHLSKKLQKHIPSESKQNLVDLGCATGTNTAALASLFPTMTITGIDESEAMINHATNTHSKPGLSFSTQSIDDYVAHVQSDIIFSNATFQWLKNPEKTIALIKKKRPSLLLFSVFTEDTFHELKYCLSDCLNHPVTLPVDEFLIGSQWVALLEANFKSVECEQHHVTVSYPDSLSLLRHLSKTGATKPFTPKIIWTPSFLKKLDSSFIKQFGMVRSTYHMFSFIVS